MSQFHPPSVLDHRSPSLASRRHDIHRIVEADWRAPPSPDGARASATATTRALGLAGLAAVFTTIGVALVVATSSVDDFAGPLAFAPLVMFAISLAAHTRAAR
jgi:hypothetical protein